MRARALAVVAVATLALTAAVAVAQAAWKDSGATTHATFAAAAEFPPLANLVPSVLGTAQVGVVLHATAGGFSPTPTSSAFAWLRCDATGAAFADVGSTLRTELTPTNGSTPGAAVRSEPTPVVLAINLGPTLKTPVAANAPTVSGTTSVGQTLTASPGTWQAVLTTFSYKWLRCDAIGSGCTPIAGATAQTYVPVAADSGHRLSVAVTGALLGLIPSPAVAVTTAVIA